MQYSFKYFRLYKNPTVVHKISRKKYSSLFTITRFNDFIFDDPIYTGKSVVKIFQDEISLIYRYIYLETFTSSSRNDSTFRYPFEKSRESSSASLLLCPPPSVSHRFCLLELVNANRSKSLLSFGQTGKFNFG